MLLCKHESFGRKTFGHVLLTRLGRFEGYVGVINNHKNNKLYIFKKAKTEHIGDKAVQQCAHSHHQSAD